MSTIQLAANLLKEGKLVAFPTETVYGLGADATNQEAVRRIYAAKKRPPTNPLIVHLSTIDQVPLFASSISDDAVRLAHVFWPGPLTLILPKQPWVLKEVTAHQETVGLRIPNHPIAHDLLQAFGGGIAAPSANLFTHVSPTTASAVEEELGSAVDLILDGGPSRVGLESTIVDVTGITPRILRPGMITKDMIEQCLGKPIQGKIHHAEQILVPGMHAVHYAPRTNTVLLTQDQINNALKNNVAHTVIISHDTNMKIDSPYVTTFHLGSNPIHYAHKLYDTLRQADKLHATCIMIEAVPNHSTWDAIRDRTLKASGRGT